MAFDACIRGIKLHFHRSGKFPTSSNKHCVNYPLMVSSYYQAERLSSQKCDLAGNPTILSGKFFQTLNAKSISSVVNVASSSNDRTADVVRNAFGWNLKNTFSNERCCFVLRTVAFHSHWSFECSLLVNWIRWRFVISPPTVSPPAFHLTDSSPIIG